MRSARPVLRTEAARREPHRNAAPSRWWGRLVLVHRTEIVFGMLKIVFCGDPVAGLGFGTSQRQVTFVVPLGVPRGSRMPNGLGLAFPELVPSLPHVTLLFPIWAWRCGRRI